MSVPRIFGIPRYAASEFDWQEPAEARRSIFVEHHEYVRDELIPCATASTVMITILGAMDYWLKPKGEFSNVVIFILILFFVVSPVTIRMASFFQRNAAITNEHLWYAEGRGGKRWKFSKLSGFFVERKRDYWILALVTKKNRVVRIGVSPDISVEAVSAFLEGRGLKRTA
jgi:hypothetical protein